MLINKTNKITLLLFLAFITFVSCDGRDRTHKTNQEILEEHKLLDSFSENVKYFPEEYTEIKTDTILSNGFRVEIKNYSDMENSILKEFKVDTIIHKVYYRKFISNVIILKNEKEFFNEKIDLNYLSKLDSTFENYKDDYVSNIVVLKESETLKTNNINLSISLCIPSSVNCPEYILIIDKKGIPTITKI